MDMTKYVRRICNISHARYSYFHCFFVKHLLWQVLYGQGMSGEKCPFHLGQGKSGKLAKVLGKIVLSYCRSGEKLSF